MPRLGTMILWPSRCVYRCKVGVVVVRRLHASSSGTPQLQCLTHPLDHRIIALSLGTEHPPSMAAHGGRQGARSACIQHHSMRGYDGST